MITCPKYDASALRLFILSTSIYKLPLLLTTLILKSLSYVNIHKVIKLSILDQIPIHIFIETYMDAKVICQKKTYRQKNQGGFSTFSHKDTHASACALRHILTKT